MIGLAGEGGAVDIFYLDFSKLSDMAPINPSSFQIDTGQ